MAVVGIFLLLPFLCGQLWIVATLKLVNNGYEDFVVAIGQDVLEDIRYFGQIEYLLKETSAYLYTATRHRAYIRSVTAVIPKTWRDDSKYTDPGEASFDNAQIRIDQPNPLQDKNPYTFQPGQCGDPGQYIHLAPDYVLDNPGVNRDINWGNPGRLLVHEFAHLRYGVFDEYGATEEQNLFYLNDKGTVVPTSCVVDMKGRFVNQKTGGGCSVNKTTNLPENDCYFFPEEDNNDAIASVMYVQYIKNITQFCEVIPTDPRLQHNEVAPNKHNKMCSGRGTWDVIKEHPDFRSANQPRKVANTTPVFNYVKSRRGFWHDGTEKCGRRVVVLLDLSGSMRHNERWFKQTQTADKFIRDILPIGSNVGVVTFSTNATAWTKMTPLKNEFIKRSIAASLPKYKDIHGNTAIGLGFQESLKLLKTTGGTQGGRILLITDGEETDVPRVATIMDDIVDAGVVVHTVAYSDAAAQALSTISQKTGGMYAYFSESDVSTTLDSSIRRLWDDMAVCKERTQVEIFRTSIKLVTNDFDYHGTVNIDDTVGVDTVFVFTFPRRADIDVHVRSPHGNVFDRNSAGYQHDTTLNIVRLRLQIAVNNTGSWTYMLRSKAGPPATVSVTVTSRPRDEKSTFTFRTWLNGLSVTTSLKSAPTVYAYVHKGYSPVIYANVSIAIEGPGGKINVVYPKDDGKLPDNTKNDGVYTAWIVSFSGNDRYSLDASVSSIPGKTSVVVAGTGSGRARSRTEDRRAMMLEPVNIHFTRTSSPGAIDVKGMTPGVDTIAPARVTDLRDDSFNRGSRTVNLKWTAPGDDLDQGRAAAYQLRIGDSFHQMTRSFHEAILVDKLFHAKEHLLPIPAGQTQEVSLTIPLSVNHTVLVFGIKTIDEAGLTSELSNLVAVTFEPVKMSGGDSVADPKPQIEDGESSTIVITACIVGIVSVGIILLVITVLLKISKAKDAKKGKCFTDIESHPDSSKRKCTCKI